ncbi:MAG: DUF1553 domain-containing protein [Gemmataceae bacterium]|nr:DUF1553 domain-containing protein [Gemmataceae bacterium]
MKRFTLLAAGLALVLSISVTPGQTKKAPDPVGADHAEKMVKGLDVFKKHVKPIFESKCLRCHGGKKVESDFDLSDREGLLKGGQIGNSVVPGKSKESQLVKLITHAKEPHMPHESPKLSDAAIAKIVEWIDLGAPYDNPLVASKLKGKSWTERVLPPSAKQWWAFEPLFKITLPAVKDNRWCRTSIDRFILTKLEDAKVMPNASATKQQLIRRAYFDLIGLPPSPEDVDAFLKDTATPQAAWEKVVDKLLASPHYGERWGRHWLDLARFGESHGFEHDYDRPTAYHYRDFVIASLNQDLPYDKFVKWQIAGDEYEPNNNLALKATGFLAAGVHSTQITKSEVEKHRYDEMDDKLNTISTAFLGLSVGCARCHDHKYDPIPQRDYYRMLSTFTTTVRSEMELAVDQPAYVKAKEAFDRAHAPFVEAMRKREQALLPMLDMLVKDANMIDWEYVAIKSVQSKDGSTLTLQDDGSILASGKNPKSEEYTITAHTTTPGITTIRLEALGHPSLVKGGPGRAPNGNFALSDFSLGFAAAKIGGPLVPKSMKLKNPRATFEQKGLPIKATIDSDAKSAWAIDPQFGKDHAAIFDLDTPIGASDGTTLVIKLRFNNNDGHNIGRLRLSISNAAKTPELAAAGISAGVREVLRIPADKRSEQQTGMLLNWACTLDSEWRTLNAKRMGHLAKAPQPTKMKTLVATEGLPAVRLHTQGEDFLPETHFLRRGDPANREGVATQGFLQVLMPAADAAKRWQTAPPPGWRTSYQRRAFAEWITDVDHGAGQLLARVIVNRVWQHHMGRGLVTTPSDFGVRGERPTHPELLDHLASELIKSGWKLKGLHKLIMTSAVYQQDTQVHEAKVKLDRDNKLYWRQPARRLEAEIIRDAMLAVSGELDTKLFGPGTLDEKSKRRSIYFTVKRSKLVPMMVIFDAPEALNGMAERPTTTIAPQALHLLNNPQVRQSARSFAKRIAPEATTPIETAIRQGYLITLARQPSREELADGVAFVDQQMRTYPENQRRESALADFCQVLMCLNEFIYVE